MTVTSSTSTSRRHRLSRAEHENKTIGIVLCSEKNAVMVKITLPEDNDQITAATYRCYTSTEVKLARSWSASARRPSACSG